MTQTQAWQKAVTLFNTGEYWECHEILEPSWLAAEGLDKHFLAGVILLAASLHKARAMGSARGGRRNYAKALKHLALIPNFYVGVNVRLLEAEVHNALLHPNNHPMLNNQEIGTYVSAKT